MIINLIDKLQGNKINLLGLTTGEMATYSTIYSHAIGLATITSICDITIRINKDYSCLNDGEVGYNECI